MIKDKITLKVAGKSSVSSVANAIYKYITEENKKVELQAVGAGAINQSVKAIATAQGHLATQGIDIATKFGFDTVQINNEDRTAIKLIIMEV